MAGPTGKTEKTREHNPPEYPTGEGIVEYWGPEEESTWLEGNFADLPEYTGETQWMKDQWISYRNEIGNLRNDYLDLLEKKKAEGLSGHALAADRDLQTMRLKLKDLEANVQQLIGTPTTLEMPDVDTSLSPEMEAATAEAEANVTGGSQFADQAGDIVSGTFAEPGGKATQETGGLTPESTIGGDPLHPITGDKLDVGEGMEMPSGGTGEAVIGFNESLKSYQDNWTNMTEEEREQVRQNLEIQGKQTYGAGFTLPDDETLIGGGGPTQDVVDETMGEGPGAEAAEGESIQNFNYKLQWFQKNAPYMSEESKAQAQAELEKLGQQVYGANFSLAGVLEGGEGEGEPGGGPEDAQDVIDKIFGDIFDMDTTGAPPGKATGVEPTPEKTEAEQKAAEFLDDVISGNVPLTEEQQAWRDKLTAQMESGLSDEERKGREQETQEALKAVMSSAAFRGAAEGSKTFAKMAEIATKRAAETAEIDRQIKERAAELRQQFDQAIEQGNYAKAELLQAQADQERLRNQQAMDKAYNTKVLELKEQDMLYQHGFNDQQMALARQWQSYNMALGKAQFDADEKQRLREYNLSEAQIAIAEQDMKNRYELGEKNWELAARGQDLNELRNEQEVGFRDRAFELQKQLDLQAADLETEKFQVYKEQLEREFGIRIDEFEFRKQLEQGKLELSALDMEWRNTIAEREEMHNFMISSEGLALQKELGMTEIESRMIIAGEQLTVQRESMLLQKILTEMGYEVDREAIQAQVQLARDQGGQDLLGQVFGSFLGIMMYTIL